MLKHLELTDAMRARIEAVQAALMTYAPGGESAAVVELPKLALADVVLAEYARQAIDAARRAARLARLPKPTLTPIVEVTLRPKRRRA
jgi:hypothetical protein